MWKNRIIYTLALTGAALFLALYPLWFSWYLMVTLLLLAPIDLIVSLPGMLTRRLSHASPDVVKQGEHATLVFTTICANRYPLRCIKLRMKVSCEDFTRWKRLVIGPDNGTRFDMLIDTSVSGINVFEMKRAWTVSLVGLFSYPVKFQQRATLLILSPPVEPPNIEALPHDVILHAKPGGGFSDDHDLRLFREGDTMRSVHWKVSAKLDSLIVREPLMPLTHSRLIYARKWHKARERDLVLGRLLWVCEYLLKWELKHYVKLDVGSSHAQITRISDLYDYLLNVLDDAADKTRYHVPGPVRFVWVLRIDGEESN